MSIPNLTQDDLQYLRNNDDLDGLSNWARGFAQRAVDAAALDKQAVTEYRAMLTNPVCLYGLISQYHVWEAEGGAITGEFNPVYAERIRQLRQIGAAIIAIDPGSFEDNVIVKEFTLDK